ncbi:MAG TPA: FxLYD domain-containing protein [Hanamia sp.]
MKKYFLLILASAFICACGTNTETKTKVDKESYVNTKEELLKKEQKSPQYFLEAKGKNKKNLLGQTVVKGTIHNNAAIAVYKDVNVKLSFYSKTGALLETDKETVYETIEPGEFKDFKTKYFAPKGTDSVSLEVLGATALLK